MSREITEEEKEWRVKSNRLLLNATRSKIDFLLSADNSIDSKAGILIGFSATILVFYLNILSDWCIKFVFLLPVIFISISIYYSIQIILSRKYDTGVANFFGATSTHRTMEEYELSEQLLSEYQEAFESNSKIMSKKNTHYKNALIWSGLAIGLIVIFYLI